ncbi:hypothetical protein [Paracoccus sulfuroxidans]|uniref:Succinate dehydrogenase n=1 Tax=Paracoccus sulfuroxidans TaxID=384678 RepID=A0A562NRZ6_9RHOB|nr:hypothetical protein [Paracoccus sulfuroxidans]TWI34968.1 hypothetical protein IQ24_01477 [Paracoccus sulfuroxidans]
MRLSLSLTVAALALSGCVMQNPGQMPPVDSNLPPIASVPSVDTAARTTARVVINREMARRLPGANVAPYTDCVIDNASASELASIVSSGDAGAAGTVAGIVGRPATSQCIARAASSARGTA